MNVLSIMDKQKVVVLWFKRDLRITDHRPAAMAIAHGLPVLCLYVYEPDLLQHPDSDIRHWRFAHQSIGQLDQYLQTFHQRVLEWYGNVLDVLEYIQRHFSIEAIYSHEEIGVGISFERDKAVAKWCHHHGAKWIESPTNGIIRSLKSRKSWQTKWYDTMRAEIVHPDWIHIRPAPITLLNNKDFELPPEFKAAVARHEPLFQFGGFLHAREVLASFLHNRIWQYSSSISKPHESRDGCSRLSAHLAWGNLSIREVYQAAVSAAGQYPPKSRQIQFFITRLFWHCHFIQKFESHSTMEFENVNKGYDLIRNDRDEFYIEAWRNGQTGYPLVDASMECLRQTGYINFRMRAMLVSFLTHNLWQHWETGVHHLASLFLDYEPGIHYPQFQMQAGTMGVHTIRTYNPVKQAKEKDPSAVFIKTWLPQLAALPLPFVHEPWEMSMQEQKKYGVLLGVDYPEPIIDYKMSAAEASRRLWEMKRQKQVKANNAEVLEKLSLRKSDAEHPIKRQKSVDLNFKLF